MGEVWVLAGGQRLPLVQAVSLGEKIRELGEPCRWHMNDCGCCLSVHGPGGAYVIGQDGGADFYPDDHAS